MRRAWEKGPDVLEGPLVVRPSWADCVGWFDYGVTVTRLLGWPPCGGGGWGPVEIREPKAVAELDPRPTDVWDPEVRR